MRSRDTELVARVESLPGVSAASVAVCPLATGCQRTSGITIDGYLPSVGEDLRVQENTVSVNYFATTGMRLVEGRDFDDRTRENTSKVAINRAMVRRFFPDGDAIGRRLLAAYVPARRAANVDPTVALRQE